MCNCVCAFLCQVLGNAGRVCEKQTEAGSGYHSDGHASGVSSDNESVSVCSEMVGHAVNTAGWFFTRAL